MKNDVLKQLNIIALVPSDNSYTLYLYAKTEKYIVPVTIEKQTASLLFKKSNSYSPDFYDTVRRIICGLGAKFISTTIYNYENSTFYAYLNIAFQNKHLEFNAHLSDALNMAKRFSAPIYIGQGILEKCGIKVSKQILKEALLDDYNA